MGLQIALIWECYTLNLKPQEQFSESGEGYRYRDDAFRNYCANAKPLR